MERVQLWLRVSSDHRDRIACSHPKARVSYNRRYIDAPTPFLCHIGGMREPNQEELRASGTIDRGQGGEGFTSYSGSHYLRHARLGSWWERILGILGLVFVLVTLTNIILRNL
jgi:hypothetical protein